MNQGKKSEIEDWLSPGKRYGFPCGEPPWPVLSVLPELPSEKQEEEKSYTVSYNNILFTAPNLVKPTLNWAHVFFANLVESIRRS